MSGDFRARFIESAKLRNEIMRVSVFFETRNCVHAGKAACVPIVKFYKDYESFKIRRFVCR